MEDVFVFINIFLISFVVSFIVVTAYLRYRDRKIEEENERRENEELMKDDDKE